MKILERLAASYLKRSYDAARRGRLSSDWMASAASEDSELFSDLATLRNRSRQMIRDNPHAKNLQRIIENNVVGTGIGCQALVLKPNGEPDKDANDRIEAAWAAWCERDTCHTAGLMSMSDILRLVIGSVFRDGEAIVRKVPQAFGKGKIPFALEVIEPDLLLDQTGSFLTNQGTAVRLGIEVNEWHRPVGYWMRTTHPGDYSFVRNTVVDQTVRIDAAQIEHLYLVERWPQTRGTPWMHMVLRRLRDIGEYTKSEIVAARAAANIVGFVQQNPDFANPNGFDPEKPRPDFVKSEPGTFRRLLPGETFSGFSPARPNANLDAFMRYMLREVAAGVGVSYETLSRDYSQSNYSSSRLALLDDRDLWRMLQGWLISNFLSRIYREWLDAAVLSGVLKLPGYWNDKARFQAVRFKPRGWSWIDPSKEVAAYREAVSCGFMSRSSVISAIGNGQDREEVDREIRADQDGAEELGLKFATGGGGQPVPSDPQPNQGEAKQTGE